MAQQHPEAPTLSEKVSAGVCMNRLRVKRLKRLVEAYEERGRHDEAMLTRERLRRAEQVKEFADSMFYPDLGDA